MAAGKQAVEGIETVVHAELGLVRVARPFSGRTVIDREVLSGEVAFSYRTIVEMVGEMTRGHARAVNVFERVEDCFFKVVASPSSPRAAQARRLMEGLETEWKQVRGELQAALVKRARQQEKLAGKEAEEHAAALVKQLDEHFEARYGFTTYTSGLSFEDPEKFAQQMRKELGRSNTSPERVAELTNWALAMPFLKTPPSGPTAAVAGRGKALVKEIERQAGTAAEKQVAKGAGQATHAAAHRPSAAEQARAFTKLQGYHAERDVLYDDLVDIVDRNVAARPVGSRPASTDAAFVDQVVDHAQGRVGEALALKHPRFRAEVWEPAQRTAGNLCDELNAALPKGTPHGERWRVEPITEPLMATKGGEGEAGLFVDSGIWLLRDAPDGSIAMPVFVLEVKSGELWASVTQQVMTKVRARTGMVDFLSTGRRYRMQLPPRVELERALASTRNVSDRRLLGLLEDGKVSEFAKLEAGGRTVLFRLPMPRTEIRAATYAAVLARLRQLEKAVK